MAESWEVLLLQQLLLRHHLCFYQHASSEEILRRTPAKPAEPNSRKNTHRVGLSCKLSLSLTLGSVWGGYKSAAGCVYIHHLPAPWRRCVDVCNVHSFAVLLIPGWGQNSTLPQTSSFVAHLLCCSSPPSASLTTWLLCFICSFSSSFGQLGFRQCWFMTTQKLLPQVESWRKQGAFELLNRSKRMKAILF